MQVWKLDPPLRHAVSSFATLFVSGISHHNDNLRRTHNTCPDLVMDMLTKEINLCKIKTILYQTCVH